MNEAKSELDEMKRIKVKITPINPQLFQKMYTLSGEQEEATSDMELVIEEDIKLETMAMGLSEQEDVMWPEGDPSWTDTTVHPVTTINSEIEETLKKDDRENRLNELKLQDCKCVP